MPAFSIGLTSAVIGTIGLLLFFLPILGIPIAGCGLLLGIAGAAAAAFGRSASLRWSIVGTVVSGFALAAGLAMFYAP